MDKTTITLGADVTHRGTGSMQETSSSAAVVGSVNDTFNQYPASIRAQDSNEEIIQGMQEMVRERNELRQRKNVGQTLSRILFYRDGVSEGQFSHIKDQELPAIMAAIAETTAQGSPTPQLLLICIIKRTKTRFYPLDDFERLEKKNQLVDNKITHETIYAWYLQSHQSLQGTAKPGHYYVLHDDLQETADRIQTLTLWHCCLFARCSKSIPVHPAARCADRAANRARAYMREALVVGVNAGQTYDPSQGW